jgi:hypothetical protein
MPLSQFFFINAESRCFFNLEVTINYYLYLIYKKKTDNMQPLSQNSFKTPGFSNFFVDRAPDVF